MKDLKISPRDREDKLDPLKSTLVKVSTTVNKLPVSNRKVAKQVENVLKGEKVKGRVEVILTGDKLLKQLNSTYAGKDKTTDVLSFPLSDRLHKSRESYLGEIYISLDQAKRQAKDYGATFGEEVLRLVTHGTLHLLGYDHKRTNQAKIMKRKEKKYGYGS